MLFLCVKATLISKNYLLNEDGSLITVWSDDFYHIGDKGYWKLEKHNGIYKILRLVKA